MPAKGKTKVNEKQKMAMAAGKLAGKTSREVGADLGVHPDTVRNHWGGHESLNLQLKRENAPEIRELYRGMLAGLKQDLTSTDNNVRHRAYQRIVQIVTAGDPPLERVAPPPQPPPEGEVLHVTLEELLSAYRQVTLGRGEDNATGKP